MMQVSVKLLGDNMQMRLTQMSGPPLEMIKLILWLVRQSLQNDHDSAPLTLSLERWEDI